MTHSSSLKARFASVVLRAALMIAVGCGYAHMAHAQQKPKRNAEVIVTLDACAPGVTYQPGFANGDNNGTLNLYIWESALGTFVHNETWNGNPGGGITHTGARHIKLLPYRNYSVTLTRLQQPMEWGDIKLNAPPGYAVFINGVARESFRVVPPELTNGIFSFSVREVGDGGLLPAGMAPPPGVADFVWTMSTGTYANGMALSPVQLRGQSLSASMLSPKALTFLTPYSPEVAVVNHSDGGLLEIDTFQAIYHFRRDTPAWGYTIEVYSPFATRTGTGDGPFSYSEQPYREYRVSNPDGETWNNRLKIEKIDREGGAVAASETWTVTQSGSNWTVVETSSLRTITRVSTTASGVRTETVTVQDNNANVATKVARKYRTFAWGQEELTEETLNPDAAVGIALTTKYHYHETSGTGGYSRLRAVEAPDGSWVRYDYDNALDGLGNLIAVHKPWRGAPDSYSAATTANSAAAILTYAVGKTTFKDLPSGSQSYIAGKQSAQTDVATTFPTASAPNGEPLRTDTVSVYSASGASNALTSVIQTYDPQSASPDFRGRKYSEVDPTGIKSSYLRYKAYFWNYEDNNATNLRKWPGNPGADNTWGEYRFNGFKDQVQGAVKVSSWDGQSFEPLYMVPNRSTVELVVYDVTGRPSFTVDYVFTAASGEVANFEFLGQREIGYDSGMLAVQRALNGFREQRWYIGDQLSGITANDGSYVEFTRDALGRDTLSRKFGIGASDEYAAQGVIYTHKTFDASNRALTEKVSSSANPADPGIASSREYYLSGLLKAQTDASGLITSFAYTNGGRTLTTTTPLGASAVDRHPLGTYSYGATVVPQFSRLVVNANGTLTIESYVLNATEKSAVDAALAKATLSQADADLTTALAAVKRWSKATSDWAGRTITEERPAPAGASPATVTKQYQYNDIGQLTKVSETGLADTLIAYNSWQRPYRTGLDLSSGGEITPTANTPNGVLDLDSKDRITETDTFYQKDGNGAWWSVGTSKQYAAIGSVSATNPTTTKTRLNKYSDHGRLGSGYIQSETEMTDSFGNVTRKTVAVQRGSSYFETNLKLVTETLDLPDSTINEIAVSRNGLPQMRQSRQGFVYRSYYDGLGRLIKTTDPRTDASATTARVGYFDGTAAPGSRHQVAWRQDSAGNQTDYAYDDKGRLVVETMPAAVANGTRPTRRFAYNLRGQTIQTWGSGTYPVEAAYNGYGELIAQRTFRDGTNWDTSAWPRTDSGSDATNAGNPTPSGWTRSTSDVTTWDYDVRTGLLQTKTPPFDPASSDANLNSAKPISYTYNARGQLKTRTWARGVVTNYHYFGEAAGEPNTGELHKVDYADTLTTDLEYTYSRAGQTASVLDATGTRQFAYDSATTALQSETFAAAYFGGRELEHLTANTGVKGRSIGYKLKAGTTVEQEVGYDYDSVTGRFNLLREGSAASPVATFAYSYATNSNLIASIADSVSGWTQTRTYLPNRDLLDVIETKMGVASKSRFDYAYDGLGRRTGVEKTGELFARYAVGGLKTLWDYNLRSEVTAESTDRVTGTGVEALPDRTGSFVYDEIGNRKTATLHGQTSTYTPNLLNQYSARTTPAVAQVSGLAPAAASVTVAVNAGAAGAVDRLGDYFFKQVPVSTAAWSTLLTASSAGGGPVTRGLYTPAASEVFEHDADGNLTADGKWIYTYDAENRLIALESSMAFKAAAPAEQVRQLEFVYDYLGRRVQKQIRTGWNGAAYATTSIARFVYQGWNPIAEYAVAGTPETLTLTRSHLWGLDLLGEGQQAGGVGGLQLVRDRAAGWNFVPAYDGNGNVMAQLHQSGGALGTFGALFEYDAFGRTIRAEGAHVANAPFRFSTKFTDAESDLVYYGLRYYSPSLGRFINRDPIEEKGGLNLYAFVANDGVNRWDTLGMYVGTRGRFDALYGESGNTGRDTGGGTPGSIGWAYGTGLGVRMGSEMDMLSAGMGHAVVDYTGRVLSPGSNPNARDIDKYIQQLKEDGTSFVTAVISQQGTGKPVAVEVTAPDGSVSTVAAGSLDASTAQGVNNYMNAIANASAASDVYSGNGPLVSFVSRVTGSGVPAGLQGAAFKDDATGFRAGLYMNNFAGQYLLAFAGTDPTSGRDWRTDVANSFSIPTAQYSQAARLAQTANIATGGNISFTGHSLGGGLASLASAVTGLSAVTFNAAGISEATARRYGGSLANAGSLVQAYYVRGEIVSLVQDLTPLPNAAGTRIPLDGSLTADPVRRHLMSQVMAGLGKGPGFP